jgi:protein-disulfide isomerase
MIADTMRTRRFRILRFLLALAVPALPAVSGWAQTPAQSQPPDRQSPAKPPKSSSDTQGITREQADAILEELRQIRQLLEKQQAAGLRPPLPPATSTARATVSLTGEEFSLGQDSAPVTILEYSDYQCPYCRRFHSGAFAELKKNYIDTGKVRFISRDMPLDFHPRAMPAAEAVRCAGEQGKFWEMRHVLLASGGDLSKEDLERRAQNLALDQHKFHACLDSEKYKQLIEKDAAAAAALGITGTPTFFIGRSSNGKLEGRRMVGVLTYSQLEAALEPLLKSQAEAASAGPPSNP